ncbi:hypothetical protein [Lederbergia galactosidilytica]|nr:hypothetical protein [Lederbergia galactosidilytica]
MEQNKIEQHVKIAALIAMIMSILTFILVMISQIWGFLELSWWVFVDMFLLLGLAYGIYKKSRICALLLFSLFLLNQVVLYINWNVLVTIPLGCVVMYYLFKGILATFFYHKKTTTITATGKQFNDKWYKRFDLLSLWLAISVWFFLIMLIIISLLIIHTSIVPEMMGGIFLFIFLALVLFGNLLFSLGGIGLGITSLVKYKDRKLFAILGIVFNILFLGPYIFSIRFFV